MVSKRPKKSTRVEKPSTSTPFVSVIIPVYKAEKTLRACLDSVIAQAYPHYEILAIDDASPDASAAILTEYAKKNDKLNVITLPQNKGAAAARNAGFDAGKGTIFLLLDSDAKVFPGWIAAHVALQEKGHSVIGGSVIAWDDTFWGWCDHYATWYEYYPQKPFQASRYQISSTNLSIHVDIISRAGKFDERLRRTCEDAEYSNRLTQMGLTIAFTPDIVMAHHDRETFWGFLRHHYTYGYMAPFVRNKDSKAKYWWLIPQTRTGAVLMILPLAILHTGFVVWNWLPRHPEAILLSPFIFASKIAHAIGVHDGIIAKQKEEMRSPSY